MEHFSKKNSKKENHRTRDTEQAQACPISVEEKINQVSNLLQTRIDRMIRWVGEICSSKVSQVMPHYSQQMMNSAEDQELIKHYKSSIPHIFHFFSKFMPEVLLSHNLLQVFAFRFRRLTQSTKKKGYSFETLKENLEVFLSLYFGKVMISDEMTSQTAIAWTLDLVAKLRNIVTLNSRSESITLGLLSKSSLAELVKDPSNLDGGEKYVIGGSLREVCCWVSLAFGLLNPVFSELSSEEIEQVSEDLTEIVDAWKDFLDIGSNIERMESTRILWTQQHLVPCIMGWLARLEQSYSPYMEVPSLARLQMIFNTLSSLDKITYICLDSKKNNDSVSNGVFMGVGLNDVAKEQAIAEGIFWIYEGSGRVRTLINCFSYLFQASIKFKNLGKEFVLKGYNLSSRQLIKNILNFLSSIKQNLPLFLLYSYQFCRSFFEEKFYSCIWEVVELVRKTIRNLGDSGPRLVRAIRELVGSYGHPDGPQVVYRTVKSLGNKDRRLLGRCMTLIQLIDARGDPGPERGKRLLRTPSTTFERLDEIAEIKGDPAEAGLAVVCSWQLFMGDTKFEDKIVDLGLTSIRLRCKDALINHLQGFENLFREVLLEGVNPIKTPKIGQKIDPGQLKTLRTKLNLMEVFYEDIFKTLYLTKFEEIWNNDRWDSIFEGIMKIALEVWNRAHFTHNFISLVRVFEHSREPPSGLDRQAIPSLSPDEVKAFQQDFHNFWIKSLGAALLILSAPLNIAFLTEIGSGHIDLPEPFCNSCFAYFPDIVVSGARSNECMHCLSKREIYRLDSFEINLFGTEGGGLGGVETQNRLKRLQDRFSDSFVENCKVIEKELMGMRLNPLDGVESVKEFSYAEGFGTDLGEVASSMDQLKWALKAFFK